MDSATVNASHLRSFIERIEKLEEEKKVIAEDIKEVYSEAKGTGFDAKIIRKIVSMRKMDREKRREEEMLIKHQFRSKPIPPEVLIPRYNSIQEADLARK